MEKFIEMSPYEVDEIRKIAKEWMLVSAADKSEGAVFGENYNSMTASWGGIGELWGVPTAFIFVRPERHTFKFTEENEYMTISFFGGERMDMLSFFGRTSGRDTDKVKETSLTPVFGYAEDGGRFVYFDEATEVFVLKKMYAHQISPDSFKSTRPAECYKKDGLHMMYACEIVKLLKKEK